MGTRTRTTLDSARAKELAANRPAASQRRDVDYRELAFKSWISRKRKALGLAGWVTDAKGGQNGKG